MSNMKWEVTRNAYRVPVSVSGLGPLITGISHEILVVGVPPERLELDDFGILGDWYLLPHPCTTLVKNMIELGSNFFILVNDMEVSTT